MPPTILRDFEATKKLFEAILDSPNGRRSLSRLARTCRAFCEPALNILWRELDSLIPILGLFPGHVLKKARKPGMGFVGDYFVHQIDFSDRPNFRPNHPPRTTGTLFYNTAAACARSLTMKGPTTFPPPSFRYSKIVVQGRTYFLVSWS